VNATIRIYTRRFENLVRRRLTNAVDLRQANFDALVARQIDSSNTSHVFSYPWRCL
jgi:hypothetical protein